MTVLLSVSSVSASNQSEGFSLDTLPPNMSLSEALILYPEIRRIYGFVTVFDEEADELIQKGIPVYDGHDCSAIDFLKSLNYQGRHEE